MIMIKIKYTYIAMIIISIGVIIGIAVLIPSIETPFEEIELTTSKCLDGSNYRFMYHKGSVNKFFIYFQGGGLCGSEGAEFLASCEERSKTELGSSKTFNWFMSHVWSKYTRFFSSKESYNPQFHNWNKVFVKYCDGMLFTGHVDTPIKGPTGIDLYFNGEKNVIGTIDHLKANFKFANAEEVIITGSSAGGIAASAWGNYISKQLTKTDNALIINDSGFPIDHTNGKSHRVFKGMIDAMIKNTHSDKYFTTSALMKSYCPETKVENMWKCYFNEYYIHKIEPPMLLLHSPYDAWMQGNLAEIHCVEKSFKMLNACNDEEKKELAAYANKFVDIVVKAQKERKGNLSLWMPYTFTHTFMVMVNNWDNEDWEVEGSNTNFVDMIENWRALAKEKKVPFLYQDKTTKKMTKAYVRDRFWWTTYLPTVS